MIISFSLPGPLCWGGSSPPSNEQIFIVSRMLLVLINKSKKFKSFLVLFFKKEQTLAPARRPKGPHRGNPDITNSHAQQSGPKSMEF